MWGIPLHSTSTRFCPFDLHNCFFIHIASCWPCCFQAASLICYLNKGLSISDILKFSLEEIFVWIISKFFNCIFSGLLICYCSVCAHPKLRNGVPMTPLGRQRTWDPTREVCIILSAVAWEKNILR